MLSQFSIVTLYLYKYIMHPYEEETVSNLCHQPGESLPTVLNVCEDACMWSY